LEAQCAACVSPVPGQHLARSHCLHRNPGWVSSCPQGSVWEARPSAGKRCVDNRRPLCLSEGLGPARLLLSQGSRLINTPCQVYTILPHPGQERDHPRADQAVAPLQRARFDDDSATSGAVFALQFNLPSGRSDGRDGPTLRCLIQHHPWPETGKSLLCGQIR
jgi:hypothetical protein